MPEAAQAAQTIVEHDPAIDWRAILMMASLFLVVLYLCIALIHRSRLPQARSLVSLDDLLLDHRTNRLSDRKVYKGGAFVVTSWVVIFMTAKLALTEWALLIYAGSWIAEDIATTLKGRLAQPLPAERPPPTEK